MIHILTPICECINPTSINQYRQSDSNTKRLDGSKRQNTALFGDSTNSPKEIIMLCRTYLDACVRCDLDQNGICVYCQASGQTPVMRVMRRTARTLTTTSERRTNAKCSQIRSIVDVATNVIRIFQGEQVLVLPLCIDLPPPAVFSKC